ncbi:hypothetical protein ACIBCO_11870 [Streptomyces violascens]|uniref:hypothetical protein n=1 Tax=Streptomyces violascens TaxID=67381 RepID=UPI0037B543A6
MPGTTAVTAAPTASTTCSRAFSATKAEVAGSILLPFAFAALVTLVGLVLRSRILVAVAGLIVLGFAILWMVRQGQVTGSLSVDSSGNGLGQGVAMALGGGLALLLAAGLMSGRRGAEPEPGPRSEVPLLDTQSEQPYEAPYEGPYEPPQGPVPPSHGQPPYGPPEGPPRP